MNKIGNLIVAVIVGLCWAYFIYRFSETGTVAKVILLIILVPYTAKVIYSFLLEHSQNKSIGKSDKLADNFTPYTASSVSANINSGCFCVECGTQNQQGTKYCCNCGKQL